MSFPLSGLSFLRLLISQRFRRQFLEFFVLEFLFRLEELRLIPQRWVGEQERAGGQQSDGKVKPGDKCVCRCVADVEVRTRELRQDGDIDTHDLVWLDKSVLYSLL